MLTPAKYWREIPQRYRLEAARCTGCKKTFFPPRLVCDECGGEEFETLRRPERGQSGIVYGHPYSCEQLFRRGSDSSGHNRPG